MNNMLRIDLPKGRAQLQHVIAASGDVIHISDVTQALSVSRVKAAKRLARWREQGWLTRVGSGAYVPASIDTLGSQRVLDDPWILVPALFAPACVAGPTAAEHWDLSEQIFKDVVGGNRPTNGQNAGTAWLNRDTTVLMYQIIFSLIDYEGEYTDYGLTKGQRGLTSDKLC